MNHERIIKCNHCLVTFTVTSELKVIARRIQLCVAAQLILIPILSHFIHSQAHLEQINTKVKK